MGSERLAPLTLGDLRPEVAAFALLMEQKLRLNDHKRGWKSDPPNALFDRIAEETRELGAALEACSKHKWRLWSPFGENLPGWMMIRHGYGGGFEITDATRRWAPEPYDIERIGHEAADIANFAMMVADVCGALSRSEAPEGERGS